MSGQSGSDMPPPLPGSSRRTETSARQISSTSSAKKPGRFRRWFWAPVGNGENWAHTIFRVLGNLFRSAFTLVALLIAFGASVAGYSFAKENRPEWFGAAHLTEWCDDQYDNYYLKHERSEKVCSARWAEYERFNSACDAAEQQTRNLLQIDCTMPKQPAYEKLKSAKASGRLGYGSDIISTAKSKRDQLKGTLGHQLSTASAFCGYAPDQLSKRRCKLENEKVDEIERELAELEELILNAEAELDLYWPAVFACEDLQRARSEEVRDKVIALVQAADRLNDGLNTKSCALRASDWAPGIYTGSEPSGPWEKYSTP